MEATAMPSRNHADHSEESEPRPQGITASTIRESREIVGTVSRLRPDQAVTLLLVVLVVVLIAASGFLLYRMDQSMMRHEQQQVEREAQQTRFMQDELEKGRNFNRDERSKDRKVIEDVGITLKATQAALVDLTRAVQAKKTTGTPIME